MPSQIIPCEDCVQAKTRFEDRGFTVTDCAPHPQRQGMCVITFTPPALSSLAATSIPAPAAAAGVGTLTPTQVKTIHAIVNLFETSQVLGDYGKVTLLPDDPGRLTYGRSQTTLGSGNLLELLQRYARNPGARFGRRVDDWLRLVETRDEQVDHDTKLHNLLRACADDPVMRETQDAFFDEAYWQPAFRAAGSLGLRSPLAAAVVYDSFVHGSWKLLRDRTTEELGSPGAAGEPAWTAGYVRQRSVWLATHKLKVLHNTVYRMDAFQRLIDLDQWGLNLPLVVRQAEISLASLSAMPPGCFDGPPPGSRPLSLQQPLLRGLDVRLVQLALSDLGANITADGVFGQASQLCVKELQIARGLPVTGAIDVALIAQLVT